jgi:hypothetical protein
MKLVNIIGVEYFLIHVLLTKGVYMDVIDKQIINDALKQYITYWQSKPFNGMEKRETDSFILRCEELRKNLLEELWT